MLLIAGCAVSSIYTSFESVTFGIVEMPENNHFETSMERITMAERSEERNIGISAQAVDGPVENLPNFERGGIIIFFHMPKTGGTSFRLAAERNSAQLEFHRNDKISMSQLKEEVLSWTLSNDIVGDGKKVKLVELHWDLDSLVKMQGDLDLWRENARKNNIPFFVFTVLRDPVQAFISFYNFFCIKQHKARTVKCHPPWDVNHLLRISPDNPQARWLCHGTTLALGDKVLKENEIIDLNKIPLPENLNDDPYCSDVLQLAKKHFDWIGLKQKSEETLALFSRMGLHFEPIKTNHNKLAQNLKLRDLNEGEKEIVRSKLKIDQELYEWATRRFTLEKN